MGDEFFRRVTSLIILAILIIISFFMLKPILMSIIIGIILAVVFASLYDWLFKITKLKNISAGFICILLIFLIVLPFWFLTPIFIEQSFQVYLISQQIDFVTPLKTIFPSLFVSEAFSVEVGSVIHSFVTFGQIFLKIIYNSSLVIHILHKLKRKQKFKNISIIYLIVFLVVKLF